MDDRRRMSDLGSKIPTRDEIESKLNSSPPPSSGLMGGLGGSRLNSGLGSGLSGGLRGGLSGGLNSSPQPSLHNKSQQPGLESRSGGFIDNVKSSQIEEDKDDDALYSYTPTRKAKEYIDKNKSTFSNASKKLNSKPRKESDITENDIENDMEEDVPEQNYRKQPKHKTFNKHKTEDDSGIIEQESTNNRTIDKIDKEKAIEGSKNLIINLGDKIKIILICIGLIAVVYVAVEHIVVEQLFNPTTYSEEMNPITRFMRTMRGEDTRNLYYED